MASAIKLRLIPKIVTWQSLRPLSNLQNSRLLKTHSRRPFIRRTGKFEYLGKASENNYIYRYICTRLERFSNSAFTSEFERENAMNQNQFLESLYQVILKRDKVNMSKSKKEILKILEKPTVEELAIICLAYFKTQNQIPDEEILRKIVERTIELLPTIDFKQPGFCAIIKSIRYSRRLEIRDLIVKLISTLINTSNIRTIFDNPYNAVHVIKLMETYRIYDPLLLNLVYQNVFSNLKDARIKDIQYVVTSLSNFDHQGIDRLTLENDFSRLCDSIVSENRFDADMQYFHLLPLLRSFFMYNYYNSDFVSYINRKLDDAALSKQIMATLEGDRTALLIYVLSRIENGKVIFMPQEQLAKSLSLKITRNLGNAGSVKPDTSLKYLDFILSDKGKKHLLINNLYRKIAISLASHDDLKDKAFKINFQFTLPHQNYADLVISKNSNAPGDFDQETLMPKSTDNQKYCLVLALRNFDFVDFSGRLSGFKKMTSSLLTELGYTVIYANIEDYNIDELAMKIRSVLDDESIEA